MKKLFKSETKTKRVAKRKAQSLIHCGIRHCN